MSEHPSNGSRALLPGQVKSWLGIVAFVLVAVAVLAFAFVAIRPATNTDLDRRTAQKALRADTESKAKALLTAPAKNADGTYRLPVADAMRALGRLELAGWIQRADGGHRLTAKSRGR